MLGLGVIGHGYWGSKLFEKFIEHPLIEARGICDVDCEKIKKIRVRFPEIRCTVDYSELLRDKNIEAVAISTPASTHYKLVKDALLCDKHVLVEKPFVLSSSQASELVELSNKKKRIILIDHTYIYCPAVNKIKKIIRSGMVGKPLAFYSIRNNFYSKVNDINVIWDLAPHDFSILAHLFKNKPLGIVVKASVKDKKNKISKASLEINYENNFKAKVELDWFSKSKVRRMVFYGTKGVILYDNLELVDKVKIFHDDSFKRMKKIYRFFNADPLKNLVEHFVKCIIKQEEAISSGKNSKEVLRLLEAASESIKRKGVVRL